MDNGIRNESHQIVEESKIQEMSSQDSPVNNSDAEVSKLDPDQISGIEKGEMFGGGAPAAEDSDLHNDFPDLTPTKSMDFPDGGTRAWLAVVGGFFCLFCSFGFINAIGVFQTYYQQNQLSQYTNFQIGWISSFLPFLMNLGGFIIGPLFDIYGPKWLLLGGSIVSVFGLMMVSLCHEYWQFFLAQGVVLGAGLSVVFQIPILCINTWFLKRRGLAIGITVSGSSLGGVLFPIALKRLFDEVGFGWGVRIAAFILLACLIVANFLVKSRLPPPGWTPGRKILDFHAFKEPVYCFVAAAATLCYWGLFTAFTFLTQYAEAYGIDGNLAFYLISIINAASIVGRILPGILADRFGVFNIQIIFTALMAIGILAYWMPASNEAAIITFALYYGFTSGGFISLFSVCCAMISPIKQIGGRIGMMSACNAIAGLTGIPISGSLIIAGTWSNGFGPMILFSGIMASLGCASYVAARVIMVGWKIGVKR